MFTLTYIVIVSVDNSCWYEFKNRSIYRSPDKTREFVGISAEACQKRCVAETEFPCLTAQYVPHNETCALSSHNTTWLIHHNREEGVELYEQIPNCHAPVYMDQCEDIYLLLN